MEGCRGVGEGPALPHPSLLLGALTALRFVLDEDSHLVPELDGVRVFSRSTHEFLHEVPGEVLIRALSDRVRGFSAPQLPDQCPRAESGL